MPIPVPIPAGALAVDQAATDAAELLVAKILQIFASGTSGAAPTTPPTLVPSSVDPLIDPGTGLPQLSPLVLSTAETQLFFRQFAIALMSVIGSKVSTSYLDLVLAADPTYAEGRVFYDATARTLAYFNENSQVKVNLGQELLVRVRNDSGAAIAKGSVVTIQGAYGQARPRVILASAGTELQAHAVAGLVSASIPNGQDGYVTILGVLEGVNTNGMTEGSLLWLSATSGAYTITKPTSPNHAVAVGYVLKADAVDGKIWCQVNNSLEQGDLSDLHDVALVSPSNGQLLSFQSSSSKWANVNQTSINNIPQFTTATLPVADASWLGRLVYVRDTAANGTLRFCRQNANDTYSWVNVA